MGPGRRPFVKIAGIALAGLHTDPLQSIDTNDGFYTNKKRASHSGNLTVGAS